MGDERLDNDSSTRNFHICYARIWTKDDRRLDGSSRISNFLNCWTRIWTKADWRPDGDTWIAILTLKRRASGRDTTSSGWLNQSSYFWSLEGIWSWSSTERRPDGLLRRPGWCKLDRNFSTQWRVRTECMSSGQIMLGLSGVRTVWQVI